MIIQLDWSDRSPSFVLRAKLDNDERYLDDIWRHPYTLEGDYLVVDSYDGIFIWNWRDDTVCTMLDSERCEWVCGFLLLKPVQSFPYRLFRLMKVAFG